MRLTLPALDRWELAVLCHPARLDSVFRMDVPPNIHGTGPTREETVLRAVLGVGVIHMHSL